MYVFYCDYPLPVHLEDPVGFLCQANVSELVRVVGGVRAAQQELTSKLTLLIPSSNRWALNRVGKGLFLLFSTSRDKWVGKGSSTDM